MEERNEKKEKNPRDGTRIRDPLVSKLRNPTENTKLEVKLMQGT